MQIKPVSDNNESQKCDFHDVYLASRKILGTSTNPVARRYFGVTATTFTKHFIDNSVFESSNRGF